MQHIEKTCAYRDVRAHELKPGDQVTSVCRWVTWEVVAVPVVESRKARVVIADGRTLTFDRLELVEIVDQD